MSKQLSKTIQLEQPKNLLPTKKENANHPLFSSIEPHPIHPMPNANSPKPTRSDPSSSTNACTRRTRNETEERRTGQRNSTPSPSPPSPSFQTHPYHQHAKHPLSLSSLPFPFPFQTRSPSISSLVSTPRRDEPSTRGSLDRRVPPQEGGSRRRNGTFHDRLKDQLGVVLRRRKEG